MSTPSQSGGTDTQHYIPPQQNRLLYDQTVKKAKPQQKSSYLAGFYPYNARVLVALLLSFFLRMNAFKFHLQEASMQEASSQISAFTAGQITEKQKGARHHTISELAEF